MKIQVTKEDIANGQRVVCDRCPIALAMSRAFAQPVNVCVTDWRLKSSRTYHFLPMAATNFLLNFDAGRPVVPFEFEVLE